MSDPSAPPPLPPATEASADPKPERALPAWRWWMFLIILGSYPLVLGLAGQFMPAEAGDEAGPALVNDPAFLMAMIAETMIGFGLFFGIAWAFGRVTKGDLFLNWRNLFHWKPWVFGGVYSVAMRFVIGLAAMAVIFGWAFFKIVGEGGFSPDRFTELVEETSNEFRPRVETLVDQEAIGESPAYLIINLTVVSFLLAGFREELWRAGVLGGLKRLHPTFFGTRKGQVCAVLIAAVIFGIGHLPMGIGAVVMTGGLGVLLGLIMVFHNNIWHAVIAHGFFNATTFIFLHLIQRYSKSFEWLEDIRKTMGN